MLSLHVPWQGSNQCHSLIFVVCVHSSIALHGQVPGTLIEVMCMVKFRLWIERGLTMYFALVPGTLVANKFCNIACSDLGLLIETEINSLRDKSLYYTVYRTDMHSIKIVAI